jgi:hypothetical protein
MTRLWVAIYLTLAGIAVSGCSGGYYVDAAQYRQQRHLAAADDPPRRARVASRSSRGMTARATAGRDDGTTGSASDIKPWPKQGTPEWERTKAQDAEGERRVKNAINSICRGC